MEIIRRKRRIAIKKKMAIEIINKGIAYKILIFISNKPARLNTSRRIRMEIGCTDSAFIKNINFLMDIGLIKEIGINKRDRCFEITNNGKEIVLLLKELEEKLEDD